MVELLLWLYFLYSKINIVTYIFYTVKLWCNYYEIKFIFVHYITVRDRPSSWLSLNF